MSLYTILSYKNFESKQNFNIFKTKLTSFFYQNNWWTYWNHIEVA